MVGLKSAAILSLAAGPWLDALVAERVMRISGPFDTCCGSGTGNHEGEKVPARYSTDMGLAWSVVEMVTAHEDADEDCFVLTRRYSANATPVDGMWFAEFLDRQIMVEEDGVAIRAQALAPTAPLAICRAALLVTLFDAWS